ncbi:DUF2244 domain-containing protein [Stenotrophomonas sp. MMGLT7]|uniref:DUF2244 domain-containing protein n=1 Tax=Stenotrophomonas sp. MMGLT7 TaxID=2901227 RepID=UPI001E3E382B|nr:DUF2244 domain-containing protein [Stenotrophomonas sp. MMGLT7]MCD7097785.1 DUF2244 domain-containing protein [Stenotrophomonas sp. MMGLT7]
MIEVLAYSPQGTGAQLRLRPRRALQARQFAWLFLALAGTMWLVAMLGWSAGNVFAPVFALLYSVLVASALRWLWYEGEHGEEIRVRPDRVEVVRDGARPPAFSAHPYWVRLQEREGRVLLGCSGRQVEVGSFLGPGERRQLLDTLRSLLAAADGRDRRHRGV